MDYKATINDIPCEGEARIYTTLPPPVEFNVQKSWEARLRVQMVDITQSWIDKIVPFEGIFHYNGKETRGNGNAIIVEIKESKDRGYSSLLAEGIGKPTLEKDIMNNDDESEHPN